MTKHDKGLLPKYSYKASTNVMFTIINGSSEKWYTVKNIQNSQELVFSSIFSFMPHPDEYAGVHEH